MKSYMENAGTVERKWYVIDASGKSVGRVAAAAASILRGKNKPTFTPHADCGDHVIIVNCDKAVFTGNKLNQKMYRHHTGWVGGLKETSAKDMMAKNADRAMYIAVKGMLPKTTLGAKALTRLRVYKGAEHNNAAQQPQAWAGEIK
jgi:large subunit ribosomal protein L13